MHLLREDPQAAQLFAVLLKLGRPLEQGNFPPLLGFRFQKVSKQHPGCDATACRHFQGARRPARAQAKAIFPGMQLPLRSSSLHQKQVQRVVSGATLWSDVLGKVL